MMVLPQQMHVTSIQISRYKSWMLKTIYRTHKEPGLDYKESARATFVGYEATFVEAY